MQAHSFGASTSSRESSFSAMVISLSFRFRNYPYRRSTQRYTDKLRRVGELIFQRFARDRHAMAELQLRDRHAVGLVLDAPRTSRVKHLGASSTREVVADVLARDHSFFVSQHGSTALLCLLRHRLGACDRRDHAVDQLDPVTHVTARGREIYLPIVEQGQEQFIQRSRVTPPKLDVNLLLSFY